MNLIFFGKLYSIIIILYSLFIIFKYIMFFKNDIKRCSNKLKNNKEIFIAIPCLREQKIIEETIKHFRKICELPIVIITTQKENYESSDKNNYVTTKMIVEDNILGKYENVYLIDYPLNEGYMADQLNYMLNNLDNFDFYDESKDWYMSLYNADSKPSKETFKSIFYYVNQNKKVIQQYSYCFKNFFKLDFVSRGFAIYQSNFEIKVGLYNASLNYKYLYNYVVGHGLTINLKELNKVGNFNTKFWCEDIYLTMKLKYNNIPIYSISRLENIENASSIGQIIKQNSVWYDTTRKYVKVYKDIKKSEKRFSINGLIGCINEFRCAINWLLFPIIFVINCLICICFGNFIMLCILLFSYLFYSFVNYYITISTINKLSNEHYKLNVCNYVSYMLALLISNIGPIYSLFSCKKEKYKTER